MELCYNADTEEFFSLETKLKEVSVAVDVCLLQQNDIKEQN